jgi:hypothetical protein
MLCYYSILWLLANILAFLQAIILISVLLGILQAPVNMLVDFLFQDIIEASTADEFKVQTQAQKLRRKIGDQIAAVDGHAKNILSSSKVVGKKFDIESHKVVLPRSRSMSIMEHLTVPDATSRVVPPALVQSYASTSMMLKGAFGNAIESWPSSRVRSNRFPLCGSSGRDLHRLCDAAENGVISDLDPDSFDDFYSRFQDQCEQLEGAEKVEFLERWGLQITSDHDEHAMPVVTSRLKACSCLTIANRDKPHREVLANMLKNVAEFSSEKINELKVATDVQVGLEVMHYFIIDLLG